MKYLFSLILCFSVFFSAFSQDKILTLEGEEIFCKVKEIDSVAIRYVLADTTQSAISDNVMREIKIADIFMITYSNGTKDVFTKNLPEEKPKFSERKENAETLSNTELYTLGARDAQNFYDGTKPFLVGGLCGVTLVYGVLPAVIIAAVPPKPTVQTASEPTVIYTPSYDRGFKSRAHGKKALNVAAGFATGVIADIVLLVVIFGW